MRILMISNRYPPDVRGGYEIICEQVTRLLRERGHSVDVLTGLIQKQETDPQIHRLLHHAPAIPKRRWQKRFLWRPSRVRIYMRNDRIARQFFKARASNYDLAVCWNPSTIGIAVAARAQSAGLPVVFYVEDYSILSHSLIVQGSRRNLEADWMDKGWHRMIYAPMRAAARNLKLEHMIFCSDYMRRYYDEYEVSAPRSAVIHNAIRFEQEPLESLPEPAPMSLLFVGRVVEDKGVHLGIEALSHLHKTHGLTQATLTIVGTGDETYLERLKRQTKTLGLEQSVTFVGRMDPQAVLNTYANYRAFLFTSMWDEPFGLSLIESMGMGTPVIANAVGAVPEIVQDGLTGFVAERDNPEAMAAGVARILKDDALWRSMRCSAWERVQTHFTEPRLAQEVDEFLQATLKR